MTTTRILPAGITVALFALAACGGNDSVTPASESAPAPAASGQVSGKAEPQFASVPAKSGAPFTIDYTIIGTPIVGSPVAIDLEIHSAFGPTPVEIGYQITDPSSMSLHEAQPETLRAEMAANESFLSERVTIIPQREGRLFLNVSASVPADDGVISTVTSIPIHVGQVPTVPEEQGVLETTEDGERVRVLTSD